MCLAPVRNNIYLMPRLYMRLVLVPIAIFTTILIAIHTQYVDDHALRDILMPDSCPAPCFLGIRPGVTSMDEAIKLLRGNDGVADVQKRAISNKYGFITWTWKNPKPSWTSQNAVGEILLTDKTVHAITISSEFMLGEIWLTLGLPDAAFTTVPQDISSQYFLYAAFYDQYGLIIRSRLPCGGTAPMLNTIAITVIESTDEGPRRENAYNDLYRAC